MEIDLLKRNTGVMSNIMDIPMIINSIYKIIDKTTKNISIDKDKSISLIKEYLEENHVHEPEGSMWAELQLNAAKQNRLIPDTNQILYYTSEPYIKILNYIDNIIAPEFKLLTKSKKNKYTDQTFFSVSRIINDVTPKSTYLAITYRILDSDGNQVLKFKAAPFISTETNQFELAVSLSPTFAKHVFAIRIFADNVNDLKPFFNCSMFSTMTIKFYQVLNYFL
jgi:hypothetical protein